MEFPKEMIDEFLIRLPVKSLTRLKCVSKEWNDFISDGNFRRRYRSRQQSKRNAPTGFICHGNSLHYGFFKVTYFGGRTHTANKFLYASENYVQKEELKSLDYINQIGYVLAASKGLLLLGQNTKSLCVYDLVSNKSVNLSRNLEEQNEVALGFKCEVKSGKLCYKVVCVDTRLLYKRGSTYYDIEIYSSESRTWKKAILKAGTDFVIHYHFIAKEIGGVFHWREAFENRIIAYDSERERASVIELPTSREGGLASQRLKELEGTEDESLQFININNDMINVWILSKKEKTRNYMDEDDIVVASRWSLVHSVRLWDIYGGCCRDLPRDPRHPRRKPLQLIGVDPARSHIVYLEIATHIYAYNHHEEVVFASSQQLVSPAHAFVHFEWPTWPCL